MQLAVAFRSSKIALVSKFFDEVLVNHFWTAVHGKHRSNAAPLVRHWNSIFITNILDIIVVWLPYHNWIIWFTFEKFRSVSKKSALSSADSDLIVSETALLRLFSAAVFFSEQCWLRENHDWSALKQRWSALTFCTHSEIEFLPETLLFSDDLLWEFNPGWKKLKTDKWG